MSVRRDLGRKLALEQDISKSLDRYHRAIVRQFIRSVSQDGVIPSVRDRDEELTNLLRRHYDRTREAFTGDIADRLPADKKPSTEEWATIGAALLAFFDRQATGHAEEINRTTDKDMRTAVRLTQEGQPMDTPALTAIELGVAAGAVLHRQLRARAVSIATTETQLAAEATKATEAEVLSGLQPTVSGRGPRAVEPLKRWDSVGDSHVREDHLIADGQEVPVNAPFIVGGEQLMYPGDTSLGASVGNIINCRCSATYDAADIARGR